MNLAPRKLRLYLLGPMRAFLGVEEIPLPPRSRVPSLLAYLVLHAGKSIQRSSLAFRFWPDENEHKALSQLRNNLHRLNQLLPSSDPGSPWIIKDSRSICWNLDSDYWLDVSEFERMISEGHLQNAVNLYKGDLLDGVYDEWVFSERERIRELYLEGLNQLVLRTEQEEDLEASIRHAQSLLRLDPLREKTYRDLMRLHALSGDRAGMVRYYNACRAALENELGVKPSTDTEELFLELRSLENTATRAQPSASARGNNLPAQLTSFIGRQTELEKLQQLLLSSRLVTLTGIAGVGKTRLAMALAERLLPSFTGGVWLADLAGLSDPEYLVQQVSKALGIREDPGRIFPGSILDALDTHPRLLILDNCEHLIEACAQLVDVLLRGAPQLTILATSIEPLKVEGEIPFTVEPLPLPSISGRVTGQELRSSIARSESVTLFIDRAQNSLPTFHLTSDNAAQVAEICRTLDGIPLALELAASRLKLLTIDQLAERLRDRFQVLKSSSRSAAPRHQTLRATLNWTHSLLSRHEKILLRRLSVFLGGFTLEAVEQICAFEPIDTKQVLDLLSNLVDKSLVRVARREDFMGVRYDLLETVHEYCSEKLLNSGDLENMLQRHLDFFSNLLWQVRTNLLRGPEQTLWFTRLDQEYENIRRALNTARDIQDYTSLARLSGALWPYWWTRGFLSEGRIWLQTAHDVRGEVTTDLQATVFQGLGRLAILQGDLALGRSNLEESLQLRRRGEDEVEIANALTDLGIAAIYLDQRNEARKLWEESLDISRRIGDRWSIARVLNNLGDLDMYQGHYESATENLEHSLALFRELGVPFGESIVLINLGRAALLAGNLSKATGSFLESLNHKRAMADKEGLAWTLEGLAAIAGAEGRGRRAAFLFGAAASLRTTIGVPLAPQDQVFYENSLSRARAQLDAASWQSAWDEGHSMPLDEILEFATSNQK